MVKRFSTGGIMKKFFKKNWFVVLIAVVFVGIVSYYIYDTNKGKLKGKSSNGEDVVYEVDGKDVTTSSFYDELYKSNGSTDAVALFKKAVADASYSTTSDMKDNAETQAESIKSNYESQYGTDYESDLTSDLASTGYTDLEEYLIEQQKINKVSAEYAKANFKDLQIRQVSYILIKFTDSDNPTDTPTADEQSRMDAVDSSLSGGTSFSDTASSLSEDTSTASNGGNLGIIDKNSSSLDSSFLEASLALNEGETSDWIRSSSYGYFKILCTASTQDTLEKNNTDSDPYVSLVEQYDTTLENAAIWKKAKELGVDFKGNDDLESTIKESFGVSDDDDDSDTSASASADASASASATASASASASSTAEGN
jgi:foldase protein PrsA